MSLFASIALAWHRRRKNCRIGDLNPYLYTARELGYDSYDDHKYARCRVCGTVWPVPKW